jgi:ATP-binding cassette, subfamily B, bacterial PglK
MNLSNEVSAKILYNVISQNYQYQKDNKSSDVISAIYSKSKALINSFFTPLLSIITSVMIVTSITIFTFIVDWKLATISILLFGIPYIVINNSIKNRLAYASKDINEKTSQLLSILNNTIGNIREILLRNSQKSAVSFYRDYDLKLRDSQVYVKVISTTPKFLLEFLAITFLILSGIFLFETRGSEKSIITLGIFLAAAQKLLPGLQNIFSSLTIYKGGKETTSETIQFYNLKSSIEPKQNRVEISEFLSIEFKNVCFSYSKGKNIILNQLNLVIKKGDKIGLIGKTGAGKSTLLDVIIGLLTPQKGEIFVNGINTYLDYPKSLQSKICYIPQDPFIIDGTIYENITLSKNYSKRELPKVYEACKKAELLEFLKDGFEGLHFIVGENGKRLSGGQRQRLNIARALYNQNIEVFILDEATSSLDTQTEKNVLRNILNSSKGNTIIQVSHRLNTLENFNDIYELTEGKLEKINIDEIN